MNQPIHKPMTRGDFRLMVLIYRSMRILGRGPHSPEGQAARAEWREREGN